MTSLLVAFITGFTTGGLSCMAVQGGLLASSLANQIEKDLTGTHRPPQAKTFAEGSSSHPAFSDLEVGGLYPARRTPGKPGASAPNHTHSPGNSSVCDRSIYDR